MNPVKLFISFFAILLYSCGCFAQTSDNYLYVDTATETSNISTQNENTTSNVEEEIPIDNDLIRSQNIISTDSVKSLQQSKQFAYVKNLDSLLAKIQDEQSTVEEKTNSDSWLTKLFNSTLLKLLFWGIAISFVLFIVFKLFFADGFLQKQSKKGTVKLVEEETDILSSLADYDVGIESAISQNNYRLAVRFLYLQSIQKLSQNNLVKFSADKTNYQYIKELSGKNYQSLFAALTHDYEYVWYGECLINEQLFSKIHNNFKQFINLIG